MKEEKNPILMTFKELRRAVGWLGILLPFVLSIGLAIITCCPIQDSISQYYYTHTGSYLTGTLCAVGLFLYAYKGYPHENDNKWCNFAAVCALGVAFIPMDLRPGEPCCANCILFYADGASWWHVFHFISAALFFLTTAYLSYYKFTMSTGEVKKGEMKYHRNRVYRICGRIIFLCLLVLCIYHIIQHFKPDFKINTLTFFMESTMLIAFGISWLVKGEGINFLNDPD